MLQREMPQLIAQFAVKFLRPGVTPERLAAVGIVDRGRRANVIGPGTLAVHREPYRRRGTGPLFVERIPNLRRQDAVVPRRPHFDFLLVAVVEAVGDHTMLAGQHAGGHVRLHRAGHTGEAGTKRCAINGQTRQVRHRIDILRAQAGNAKQHNAVVHGSGSLLGGYWAVRSGAGITCLDWCHIVTGMHHFAGSGLPSQRQVL